MKREVLQRAGPAGCSAESGSALGAGGRRCGEAAATAVLGPPLAGAAFALSFK